MILQNIRLGPVAEDESVHIFYVQTVQEVEDFRFLDEVRTLEEMREISSFNDSLKEFFIPVNTDGPELEYHLIEVRIHHFIYWI